MPPHFGCLAISSHWACSVALERWNFRAGPTGTATTKVARQLGDKMLGGATPNPNSSVSKMHYRETKRQSTDLIVVQQYNVVAASVATLI